MQKEILEFKAVQIITWGALIATLIITDRISYEPANLGKMVALAISAFGAIFLLLPNFKQIWKENKMISSFLFIFLTFCLISIIVSETLFIRGFYGAMGRSTGLLTYLSLAIFFFASMSFVKSKSFGRVIYFFYTAAIINILYCIAASLGYDLLTWDNTYNKVLGTFGNPNFIASFMGIFFGVNLACFDYFKGSWKARTLFFIVGLSSVFVIYESGSLQGFILVGLTSVLYIYFKLHFNEHTKLISKYFLSFSFLLGFIALAGVLQKGPLASLLYKPSISFRGEYWQAGINMAKDHMLFGIGLDSYGLYYRQYRDATAAIYPGVNVVTDAAHNVVIDIFAGAGVFALLSYLAVVLLVFSRAIRYFRALKQFDPLFTALFLGWISYQVQSTISINQIGLAVWGWVFGGCLIAYTRIKPKIESDGEFFNLKSRNKSSRLENNMLPAGRVLTLILGVTFGVAVSAPSLIADINFRQAFSNKETTVEKVVSAAEKWPQDNSRMERVVVALTNQNLPRDAQILAAKYALLYPNDYASWNALWTLSPDGSREQEAYKKRLSELDPLNSKWK